MVILYFMIGSHETDSLCHYDDKKDHLLKLLLHIMATTSLKPEEQQTTKYEIHPQMSRQ